jgi:Protein of unknown function (DUF3631)
LGWLPDTLLTRSVIIRMRRRKAGERVEPWRHRIHAKEGEALGDLLAGWARHILPTIIGVYPEMPPGIEDRDADVWEALLSVAEAAGGKWPERARKAAKELVGQAADVEPSLGIRLLADLQTVFASHDAMASKAILRALIELEEAPWGDLRGKPLDERGLARRLRQYDVRSKQVRIGDMTLKGYSREDLHDVWGRYLPPLSPAANETNETNETSADPTRESAAAASETHDCGNETSETPERPVSDVSDSVSDRFASGNGKSPAKARAVSDVSDVSLVPAHGGDSARTCAQCGRAPPDGLEEQFPVGRELVWLHRECRRFYRPPLAAPDNGGGTMTDNPTSNQEPRS